jgi:hypothetical protein
LLVAGGHVRDEANPRNEGIGEDDVNVFNHLTNTWTRVGLMAKGRWYPSSVTLASGETVIVSGYDSFPARNDTPDLFTLAGGVRGFSASAAMQVYPFLHLAPNGQVFVAGPGPASPGPTKYFDPAANDGGGLFSTIALGYDTDHFHASSVIYDAAAGRVLMIGGRQFTAGTIIPDAVEIDLSPSNPSPSWQPAFTLAFGRKFHNATVLPDGKVLVTGGTQCKGGNSILCLPDGRPCTGSSNPDCKNRAATRPELWDPQTGTLTTMAPNPSGIPRVYHSVALLLPDARVLVGGGGLPAAGGEVVPTDTAGGTVTCTDAGAPVDVNCRVYGHKDAEIFRPPYLFTPGGELATRPTINSAPASITPGQNFDVGTSSALQTGSVVLIRLPSVTHGFNFDQRRVALSFQATSSTNLSVAAPADGRICPPGHYMLFVLASGVPSVAKIVKVEPNTQPPSAPSGLDAEAAPAPHVNLTWGASTGNFSHYVVERAPTLTGPFSTVGPNVTGTSFTDTTAASGAAYLYRVRAVGPSGAASAFSNTDLATTVLFTDHPLFPGVLIRAEHVSQLRQAVDAVRAAAELPAVNWTDPNLSTAVFVKAAHLQELRTNLDQALSRLGLPTDSYTDTALTPDFTLSRAVHWQEIRDRVK